MKRLRYVSKVIQLMVCLLLCGSVAIAGNLGERDSYDGTLRVYVTELVGRWNNPDNDAYHNAFLAFAIREEFSLSSSDTLTWYTVWDGHDYFDDSGQSFGDLEEDNVKVIAAVFDADGYTGYSDPPDTFCDFTVNEVDACAGATCGSPGYNMVNADFTHTVLEEDGTTTW